MVWFVAWFLFGYVSVLVAEKLCTGQITAGGLFYGIFAGLVWPLFFFWLFCVEETEWQNKRIW